MLLPVSLGQTLCPLSALPLSTTVSSKSDHLLIAPDDWLGPESQTPKDHDTQLRGLRRLGNCLVVENNKNGGLDEGTCTYTVMCPDPKAREENFDVASPSCQLYPLPRRFLESQGPALNQTVPHPAVYSPGKSHSSSVKWGPLLLSGVRRPLAQTWLWRSGAQEGGRSSWGVDPCEYQSWVRFPRHP